MTDEENVVSIFGAPAVGRLQEEVDKQLFDLLVMVINRLSNLQKLLLILKIVNEDLADDAEIQELNLQGWVLTQIQTLMAIEARMREVDENR
jgi:hypothetical protein